MTHLTSICWSRDHHGPAKAWPPCTPCREPGKLGGDPAQPPRFPWGVSGRSPRPRAAPLDQPPHCSSAGRAALGGATYTPGPPPRCRRNPAQPRGDARAASTLAGPRNTSRLLWLLRLRPAAEGAGPTYPRQRRPFSGARPRTAPGNPLGCGRQSRQLLRLCQEPRPRKKRPAQALAATAPESGRDREAGPPRAGA